MSRIFENWVQAYLEYTKHTEAPTITHIWTAVSTLAGALRRRVWLPQRFFEWTPNFYIFLVAKPGIVNKSTTINIGMDLLRRLEPMGIHFGPSSITWQALITSMAENQEQTLDTDPPILMSAITIAASEMGTLLDPKNREMIDVLVDLWDGRRMRWEKKTKHSGCDTIENPWINIIACTTPAWLAENMPESMIGGGFTSRCIFVYGREKENLIAYQDSYGSIHDTKLADDLTRDLEKISRLAGPFTISPEAREWGTKWYEDFYRGTNPEMAAAYVHLNDARFDGYRSRKQAHMHKLAMVLSAAKRSDLIITKADLIEADHILTATERDSLPFIFQKIGQVETSRVIDRILELLRAVGKMPRSEVFKELLRIAEPRIVNDVINGCVAANVVRLAQYGDVVFVERVGD